MAGFLLLLVVDWVMMRKTTKNGNTGIRSKLSSYLEDLDFADDPALIRKSTFDHIQTEVSNLGRYEKFKASK